MRATWHREDSIKWMAMYCLLFLKTHCVGNFIMRLRILVPILVVLLLPNLIPTLSTKATFSGIRQIKNKTWGGCKFGCWFMHLFLLALERHPGCKQVARTLMVAGLAIKIAHCGLCSVNGPFLGINGDMIKINGAFFTGKGFFFSFYYRGNMASFWDILWANGG